MSAGQNSTLHSFLFEEGRELVNIKFFPGSDRGLTKDQLEAAASDALRRAFEGGLVNNPPFTGKVKGPLV